MSTSGGHAPYGRRHFVPSTIFYSPACRRCRFPRAGNRLVSLKLESVAVKWRVVSESRKLSNSENFKDIFISPDLTRKQAEEDRKLRLKLKEIRMNGEVLDGVKISKGRIVGRVDGHVIYDPSA